MLIQRDKVVAYASRKLKVHETNSMTHDLELGIVVLALKNLETLLVHCEMYNPYKSKKSPTHHQPMRTQHETTKMAQTFEW